MHFDDIGENFVAKRQRARDRISLIVTRTPIGRFSIARRKRLVLLEGISTCLSCSSALEANLITFVVRPA